jgi:hypothetical protein
MKTPREILLARHQAANPKLDEIRNAVVADLEPKPVREEERATPIVLKLWRELIWPCRRTWAGLAAVWLAIFVLNHSEMEGNRAALAKTSVPREEMRFALREQRRVLEEIVNPALPTVMAEPPRRPNNQPRSEHRAIAMA